MTKSEVGETGRLHALIEQLIQKWRDRLNSFDLDDCSALEIEMCADELSAALREAGQAK